MRTIMGCIFTIFVIMTTLQSGALADPWTKSLDMGLNLSQNSYSENWGGGDVGSMAWMALANGIFEKQVSPKFNFKNITKLQFGQTHTQDQTTKNWQKPIKSTDKIDVENLGRFTLKVWVDPYVAFRLETQFLDASYEPLKRALNPMLLTESAGIAKTLFSRNKDQILTRLGLSLRERLNRVIPGTPEDTLTENTELETTTEGGLESVTDVQYKLASNISYIGKLSLFKALFFSKKNEFEGTPAADYWKTVDANFENGLSVAFSKYVSLSFYAQLLYDKQIDLKGRFKETFGLGLTYKMI